jgi:hypothetical protein
VSEALPSPQMTNMGPAWMLWLRVLRRAPIPQLTMSRSTPSRVSCCDCSRSQSPAARVKSAASMTVTVTAIGPRRRRCVSLKLDLTGALDELVRDGVLTREGGRVRTSRRWQGAMARAALELHETGADFDLRRPIAIALALISLLGDGRDDRELARYVAALVAIECDSLEGRR